MDHDHVSQLIENRRQPILGHVLVSLHVAFQGTSLGHVI